VPKPLAVVLEQAARLIRAQLIPVDPLAQAGVDTGYQIIAPIPEVGERIGSMVAARGIPD